MAYREQTRGITLDNLALFEGYPSEIGLTPYFLKAVCLWSNMANIHVCHQRFRDPMPPTDPRNRMFRCTQAVQEWWSSLAPSLQWSIENYHSQRELGQGKTFLSLHAVLRSSLCVAHQSYLPQLDGLSVLLDSLDAAGWSLLRSEPALIAPCLSNAMLVGDLVTSILDLGPSYLGDLQSIWLACSVLSVANTYFDTISSLLALWAPQRKEAKAWAAALQAMQATYRAAYVGEIPEDLRGSPASSDGESSRGYQPQPGDGFPAMIGAGNLYSYLRMITTDPAASSKDLRSVWMHLAVGWQQELSHSLIAEDL